MRNRRAVYISVFALLMVIVASIFIYEYVSTKAISYDSIFKGGLVAISAVIFLVKGLYGAGGRIPYQKYEAAYVKELEKTFVKESNKKECFMEENIKQL